MISPSEGVRIDLEAYTLAVLLSLSRIVLFVSFTTWNSLNDRGASLLHQRITFPLRIDLRSCRPQLCIGGVGGPRFIVSMSFTCQELNG